MFICCFFNLKYIIKSFFIAEIIAIFCRPIKIPISSSTYFLLFFEKYARVMSDEGQEIRSAQLAGVIFAFCILFILLSLFLEYCLSFFRSNFLILVFRGKTNFCFFFSQTCRNFVRVTYFSTFFFVSLRNFKRFDVFITTLFFRFRRKVF